MSILSITYVFWWVDLHLHTDYDYGQFFINNSPSTSNKQTLALLQSKMIFQRSEKIIIIKLT